MFYFLFSKFINCCLTDISRSLSGIILLKNKFCLKCNKTEILISNLNLSKNTIFCSMSFKKWKKLMNYGEISKNPQISYFRNGVFLGIYNRKMSIKYLNKLINDLINPPIINIDENYSKLISFKSENINILFSSKLPIPELFNQISLKYRDYGLNFYHKIGKYGIQLINNFEKKAYNYLNTINLDEWIKKNSNFYFPIPYLSKNSSNLIAILNNYINFETLNLFSLMKNEFNYLINFNFAHWNRDKNILLNCQLSHNNLTFIFLKNNNFPPKCNIYSDIDVLSLESLQFFVRYNIRGKFDNIDKEGISGFFKDNIQHLNSTEFLLNIPNNNYSIVFFDNPNSFSRSIVNLNFLNLSKNFLNLKFFQINIEENWLPSYVPNNDNFPLIVLYKPNDKRPFIFQKPFNLINLINWINSFF